MPTETPDAGRLSREHGGKSFDRNMLGFDEPKGATAFLAQGRERLDS